MKILSERAIREHYRRCFKKDALNMGPDRARQLTAAELRLALDIFRLKGELRLANRQGLRWYFEGDDIMAVKAWRMRNKNFIGLSECRECFKILDGGQS